MVFLLMRTHFSLSSDFFLCFVRLFCALAFYILFFHKSATKTIYNSRVSKKFSYVYYIFSALTSKDCLINIATANTKTHNTKVIDLVFLFLLDIWFACFG
jgi:hypothetical protein